MELLSVEGFDLETSSIEVLFDGILKEGFYVTTDFDYDVHITEADCEDTNCKEWKEPMFIYFINFRTYNADNDEIKINKRELKKIKQLVEFKLIDILTDEINNI